MHNVLLVAIDMWMPVQTALWPGFLRVETGSVEAATTRARWAVCTCAQGPTDIPGRMREFKRPQSSDKSCDPIPRAPPSLLCISSSWCIS